MSTVLRCTDWRTFAISIGKSTPETNINRAAHFLGTQTPSGTRCCFRRECRRITLAFAARTASVLVGCFFVAASLSLLSGVGIIGSICVGIVAQFIIDTPFVDNPIREPMVPEINSSSVRQLVMRPRDQENELRLQVDNFQT